jgi:AP endonuclease-2
LRPLCDANRGAATAPPDAHGVSRPLGFGSAANLLASLGSRADNIRVVCLQETKLGGGGASEPRAALDARLACPDGWESVHAVTRDPKKAAGYAGVATYWRRADTAVVAAEVGVTGVNADGERGGVGCYGAMRELFTRARAAELDAEGRCVLVDFGGFVLVNVYVPATTGGSGSEDVEKNARDAFKRDFLLAVETRVDALVDAGRRVVACGDWNVARGTMDAAAARTSTGTTDSKLGSSSAAREREFVRACPHRAWLDRQLQRDDGGGDDDDADGGGRRRPRLIDAFRRVLASIKRFSPIARRFQHLIASRFN